MPVIKYLRALEILDSRGRPTVQATCGLADGVEGVASVPSGASTGSAEALELRDGEARRYRGLGCRKAVGLINGPLTSELAGRDFPHQLALDSRLIELDGTANKSHLGANTILAISLAFARASAKAQHCPLYQYFSSLLEESICQTHISAAPAQKDDSQLVSLGEDKIIDRLTPSYRLPRPTINLFSGGKHAGAQVPIQDVLVIAVSATKMDEALAMTFEVYQTAVELIYRKYGMRLLKADEGGLAPAFSSAEAMFDDALEAICRAGFKPGSEMALAVDVASSQFHRHGWYEMPGRKLSSLEMIDQLLRWLEAYPIISLEDGLAEDDWTGWPVLCARAGAKTLILGDDLLCTNPVRIRRAIDTMAANALLLKVNQVGTLSEAAEAFRLASAAGWSVTISARSGETEDHWLADLAVGWQGRHIKIGSIAQSERLAKYNRLLEIESETGWHLG